MNERYDTMIIVAHPDDAEFGVAGSVADWIAAGRSVIYVVCTNGEKGTSDRTLSPEILAVMRRQEQQDAASLLGVGRVIFLDMPDQGLEDTPAFRETVVRLIRQYRPETVATSDPYRRYVWHRDHRIIGQVVLDAAFPYARDHLAYPQLLADGYEPHKVRELLFFGSEESNYHIDITETFPQKLAALKCHVSQVKEMRVDDLEKMLKERCRKMAAGTDYALAEAFHRVRMPA
jgi:LmbE family N-acetylglucosaminyl deacetylase